MNHVLEMAEALASTSPEAYDTYSTLVDFYADREKHKGDFGLSAMKSELQFSRAEEYLYQMAEHYCGSEPATKAEGTTVEELKNEVEMAYFLQSEMARAYNWGLALAWSIMTQEQRDRFEQIVTH